MLRAVAVENYRSLRRLLLPLRPLTLVTGPNGSGKSSLYRALRLLAESCHGNLVASLAGEGGLPSTMWAGPETIGRTVRAGQHPVQGTKRSGSIQLRLGFATADGGYVADLGLPQPPRPHSTSIPKSSGSVCGPGPCCGRPAPSSTAAAP